MWYLPEAYQDTVINRPNIVQDTLLSAGDSLYSAHPGDSVVTITIPDPSELPKESLSIQATSQLTGRVYSSQVRNNPQSDISPADTIYVCRRNPIADITFYNPDFIIRSVDHNLAGRFPIFLTENNAERNARVTSSVHKHLNPGELMPKKLFHEDWILGILIFAVILFSTVQASTKNFLPGISRFFLFRGTKEEGIREITGIFQWKSTILNLSSFLIIALYVSFALSYYDLVPREIQGFTSWLIALAAIITSLTLRHLACAATGLFSNQKNLFYDYLHTVYQSYRFGAIFIFILIIMMSYTTIFPVSIYFISGAVIISILYIIRVFRLFILFINRNISIFYLILYLCALEILPVLIAIKYFSGPV